MIGKEQYDFLVRLKCGDMTEEEVAVFLSEEVGYARLFAESLSDCCYQKYSSRNGIGDIIVYTISPNAFGAMEEYRRNVVEAKRNFVFRIANCIISAISVIVAVVAVLHR